MFSDNSKVIEVDLDREMRKSFIEYSMSVIVSRALPDVRDGLKPVHRRILYTMHEKGLTPDKAYHKCADTVGSVLGSYHPHGDASVYDALVRLAQSFSLRYPLVDGHGNFGTVDGDPPAAYRYTEARMSKISLEMLTDIGKETVDYQPNYDDRLKEPVVLPSRFPNLLVNGSVGIAVGMATNIPPHNLGEVIDAINLLIEKPDASLEDLMTCIQGPDFPTGGILMGRAAIRAAYATGQAKLTLRSKTEIEEIKGRNCIIVTEIPYMVNKARLIKNIADLVKEKRIEGIYNLRDETSREGMRIVIELKREAIPDLVRNKLFSLTQLQDTVGVQMLALVNGEPKILPLKSMLEEYLKFQVEVISRRTMFDLKKARTRAHLLQGFALAIDHIDEVVSILRSSKSIAEGKERLMERFQDVDIAELLVRAGETVNMDGIDVGTGLSEEQAEAIVQMRLGQLTGLERQKILDELSGLSEKIADFLDILARDERKYAIIRQELGEIRKRFGDERRTQIETVSGEVDIEDLIPVEDCMVTLTDIGYIKRVPVDVYKAQRRGGRGVTGMKQREEDFVHEMFIASSHDHVLFLTNKGLMFRLKCYEIPEGGKSARGMNAINLLALHEGEKIAAMLKTEGFEEGKFLVMVTKKGKIKRTPLSDFKNVRKNGLISILLEEDDELAGVLLTEGDDQLIAATRCGMAIRISETCVRPQSRGAHGVRLMQLRGDDTVVAIAKVEPDTALVTMTDKGLGRVTALSQYRLQNRGGYGLTNYKCDPERGSVCGIQTIAYEDDIVMISSDGIVIRIRAKDLRLMGRTAKGVRVMRLAGEDSRLVSFTRTDHDDSDEITAVEQLSDEELASQEAEAAAAEQEEPEAPAEETI